MIAATITVVLLLTVLGTLMVRHLALRLGMLDVPNQRSSHARPTPRGGGVAIALATLAGLSVIAHAGAPSGIVAVALIGGGLAVATVGFVDDHSALSPAVRLIVHLLASGCLVVAVGDLPPQPVGDAAIAFGWTGSVVAVLGIAWFTNLFNFMDGIDGIAASEAAFIALAAGLVLAQVDAPAPALAVFGCIAASSLGFLVWNWAPARIFMGDAGSGFLGYTLAGSALWASRELGVPVWTWLILGSVFIADATVTLVRRVCRGERWHAAHRSHAYQHLARRWRSHARVSGLVLVLDTLVMLPLGLLSVIERRWSFGLAIGTLVVVMTATLLAGAGRAEAPAQGP